jgi:SAM-dependent methyltransferase
LSSALADKWTVFDKFLQFWRYRKVVGLIPVNCVLADLGCGRGDFLRYIQSRIAVGYGFDTKIAISDGGGNLYFKEADLNNSIPLNDKSIDVVTSLAVLEHLHTPAVFVKEIF